MILIVGAHDDPHVVSVTRHIEEQSGEYIIFDPYASIGYLDARVSSSVSISTGCGERFYSNISVVWWRLKPCNGIPIDTAENLYNYDFRAREWNHYFDYLDDIYSGATWVNRRASARLASNKIRQLKVAESLGFRVPKTLVSNSPVRIEEFIDGIASERVAFKTQTPYASPTGKIAYTRVISKLEISQYANSITACPAIFQEYVEKDFELRVTIVGEKLYPVKIDSNRLENARIDWRMEIFSDLYSIATLSSDISNRLLALHKELGLFYGAYDLIVARDGNVIFLEVNPSGQWMWLEDATGIEISKSLALSLLHLRSNHSLQGTLRLSAARP